MDVDPTKVLSVLKSNSALLKKTDKMGQTVLIVAAARGLGEVVHSILTDPELVVGVNINAVDKSGHSALLAAASNGWGDIVKELVSHRVDVDAVAGEGWFTVHYLAKHGLLAELKQIVDLKRSELLRTTLFGNENVLHVAVLNSQISLVQFLVDGKKIDINAVDKNGDTPLHLAVVGGDLDLIKILLSNRAKTNVANKIGNTPLHLAAITWQQRADVFIKLLVESGGDVNLKNHKGQRVDELFRSGVEIATVNALRNRKLGAKDGKTDELVDWLQKYNLSQNDSLLRTFKRQKLHSVQDIRSMCVLDDQELADMGLNRLERKLIVDALEKDKMQNPQAFEEFEETEATEGDVTDDENLASGQIMRSKDADLSKYAEFCIQIIFFALLFAAIAGVVYYLLSIEHARSK